MLRLTVILIGVAWASLLLISWSSPTVTLPATAGQGVAATQPS